MIDRVTFYCDDKRHAAQEVPALRRDPFPVLPDDVFVVAQFVRTGDRPGELVRGIWECQPVVQLGDRTVSVGAAGDTIRHTWEPECGWCHRLGGYWARQQRDNLLDWLAGRGTEITAISLRATGALYDYLTGPPLARH